MLSDTLPQWLQDTVKRLNTIGCGSFSKSSQGKSCDGSHLLLFINQAYKDKKQWLGINKFTFLQNDLLQTQPLSLLTIDPKTTVKHEKKNP